MNLVVKSPKNSLTFIISSCRQYYEVYENELTAGNHGAMLPFKSSWGIHVHGVSRKK